MIPTYITIGGVGSRLKNISSLEKYNLYYKDQKIIDHILDIVPEAKIIGHKKTKSRKDTLLQISDIDNVLIIDCDIIPLGFNYKDLDLETDNIYTFVSNKNKYGSIILNNNCVSKISEQYNISNIKCSGVYFCKNLKHTINHMTDDNSIASGMIGSRVIMENTFKRFGDIEDYYESLGLRI
jgi:hypothetical protein